MRVGFAKYVIEALSGNSFPIAHGVIHFGHICSSNA
jgi:hypothetical protein